LTSWTLMIFWRSTLFHGVSGRNQVLL